jgi:hypothetical protein
MTTQDFSNLAFLRWSYLPLSRCWQAFPRKRFVNILTQSSPWSCHSLGGYTVFTMLRPGFSCKAKNMEVKWTIWHCEKLLPKLFSFPVLVIIAWAGHIVYHHPWLEYEQAQPALYHEFWFLLGIHIRLGTWLDSVLFTVQSCCQILYYRYI